MFTSVKFSARAIQNDRKKNRFLDCFSIATTELNGIRPQLFPTIHIFKRDDINYFDYY